jgi:uncharacterized PurR-regulated membrane protein YhhQ (DUF165 family)
VTTTNVEPVRVDPLHLRAALAFTAFVGCVWGANWALGRFGIVPFLGWSALMVPAGTYFAGLTFGIRDVLHEWGGRVWVYAAIISGAVLSYALEDARKFAIASGVAFLVSETVDALIYTPLRERNWPVAVTLSNVVGSLFDSFLFLTLAFSWGAAKDGWFDLTVGKALMTVPILAIMVWVRRRR